MGMDCEYEVIYKVKNQVWVNKNLLERIAEQIHCFKSFRGKSYSNLISFLKLSVFLLVC